MHWLLCTQDNPEVIGPILQNGHYSHFTEEKTEAQRGEITCPTLRSLWIVEWDLNPALSSEIHERGNLHSSPQPVCGMGCLLCDPGKQCVCVWGGSSKVPSFEPITSNDTPRT